ncbi:MAG: hypothetical protein ORO03_03785 [Alphaproteobacteria bacterium]|nr:hypothetical protein [Alphaproteobacteria bacterium]
MAQVALCQTEGANLIFKWLRDPKYRSGAELEGSGLNFLPVEIVKQASLARPMPAADNQIEIELACGHRMRISGG